MISRDTLRNSIAWLGIVVTIFSLSLVLIKWSHLINSFSNSQLNLVWLFEGSREDFQNWFPRFHQIVFWIIKITPPLGLMGALSLLFSAIYRLRVKIKTRVNHQKSATKDISMVQLVKKVALYLAFSLAVFLTAYFSHSRGLMFQNTDNVNAQLILSRGFMITILIMILVLVKLHWNRFKKQIEHTFLVDGNPYNLAVLRILFFGFMTVVFWRYPEYHSAYLDLEPVGLPYMNWYIELVQLKAEQYTIVCRLGALVNFLICIGFLTRPMLIFNSALVFVVFATPNFYGKLFHQHLWIWIPWILAFSRCADVLSVDSWLAQKKGGSQEVRASLDYALPVRLVWLSFAVVYFFPGFQKLWTGGFDWALSDSMLNQIYVEWKQHYGWRSVIPVERFPNLVKCGGLIVILFELAFPFLLINERSRRFAVVGGISFHFITGLVLRIWFPPVLMMYIFFVDWARLFRLAVPKSMYDRFRKFTVPNRITIVISVVLLVGNSICGFLSVYSYPFTSFPGYTNLYSSRHKMVRIDIQKNDGAWMNIDEILRESGYRREDNILFEDQIIEAFLNGDEYNQKVESYWNLLNARVPELSKVVSYKFDYQIVPLHPDSSEVIISNRLIVLNHVKPRLNP